MYLCTSCAWSTRRAKLLLVEKIPELFIKYDEDKSGTIEITEVVENTFGIDFIQLFYSNLSQRHPLDYAGSAGLR